MNITFTAEDVWAVESPVKLTEGETITFSCLFWDTPSSVSCVVYKNGSGTAVTSTVMPSGSVSISGNSASLKAATAMVGNSRYVFAVTATVGGNVRVRKFMGIVQKDEGLQ